MRDASQTEATAGASRAQPRPSRRLVQITVTFVWWIGSLFLGAGRIDWIRGWISVALMVVGMATLGFVVHHYNPSLMEARAKWHHKDTKRFDKIFLAVYVPLVSIQPAVAGLDAVRFRWSSMPFLLVYVGSILFTLAMVFIGWAMSVNPYAEQSVRIQTDRGQTVVGCGPYRIVRHPMYVGAILMYLATPLVWGSRWGLLLGGLTGLMMIWRTAREDGTLQMELPGYEEYSARTHYRLLPGVW